MKANEQNVVTELTIAELWCLLIAWAAANK